MPHETEHKINEKHTYTVHYLLRGYVSTAEQDLSDFRSRPKSGNEEVLSEDVECGENVL